MKRVITVEQQLIIREGSVEIPDEEKEKKMFFCQGMYEKTRNMSYNQMHIKNDVELAKERARRKGEGRKTS